MDNPFDLSSQDYSGLDTDKKYNLIQSLLPGFIELGYSANQTLDYLKEQGLGIARTAFLGLFREVLGIEEQANRIRYVSGDKVPSENILMESELPITDNYKFIYEYSYIDKSTGYLETSYSGITRNTLDTVNNMLGEAADDITELYPERVGELLSIRIIKGFRG